MPIAYVEFNNDLILQCDVYLVNEIKKEKKKESGTPLLRYDKNLVSNDTRVLKISREVSRGKYR